MVYVPQNYKETKKYPLLIAIHWNEGSASQQIDQWGNYANQNYFIILSPQFHFGYQWLRGREDILLKMMMAEVKNEFSIDQQRIYLVGYSGGAQFAHRFAFKHPSSIDGACVMAAGQYDDPPRSSRAKVVDYFVSVGLDDHKRVKYTENFYKALKRKGYKTQFHMAEGVGHYLDETSKQACIEFLNAI